jgi:hypothetical protein
MQRRTFLIGAGCALAGSPQLAAAARPRMHFLDPENGQWGEALTARDSSGVLTALSPRALYGTVLGVTAAAAYDARAVILTNLPTVATQGVPGHVGAPGSCEAQSFGYGLGTYTAARNADGSIKWSAADPANQPSAAWLYQWEHQVTEHDKRICPQGTGAKPYLDKLVADGAPSTAQVPYDPNDVTTVPAECTYIKSLDVMTTRPGASHVMIGSYKIYPNVLGGKATYLPQFKDLIRHGHAIAFTGLVAKMYSIESPPLTAGVFTAPDGYNPHTGHGQVIFGFDDSKGPNGAFLVQNSFGPGWNAGPASDPGRNGRIWWDYDAFFAGQKYVAIAFPIAPPAALTPGRGALTLQADDPGAPRFSIASAGLYSEGDAQHLVFVTQASDAVTITGLHVRGPSGPVGAVALNETMRSGYQYLTRRGGATFAAGTYHVRYAARTRSGRTVLYRGVVRVGPLRA